MVYMHDFVLQCTPFIHVWDIHFYVKHNVWWCDAKWKNRNADEKMYRVITNYNLIIYGQR